MIEAVSFWPLIPKWLKSKPLKSIQTFLWCMALVEQHSSQHSLIITLPGIPLIPGMPGMHPLKLIMLLVIYNSLIDK